MTINFPEAPQPAEVETEKITEEEFDENGNLTRRTITERTIKRKNPWVPPATTRPYYPYVTHSTSDDPVL